MLHAARQATAPQAAPLSFLNGRQPVQQGVNPPTLMFNGCTVNITCTDTNTMDIMHPTTSLSRKRNRSFIDDSDED